MILSIIAAVAENGVIGRGGKLPWRLSEDLKRFKALTWGKPILMGRRTYESIGRPLPGRRNIVLTRRVDWSAEGVTIAHTPAKALACAQEADEIMIIGGADVYRLFLPMADRLYLTRIQEAFEGDARFPEFAPDDWREIEREEHPEAGPGTFPFCFVRYERIKGDAN